MTISIFLMGAQLKCARALSKIYKPSRTLEGAIPLQRYRHWPAVCAACVLSNTHTHTHRGNLPYYYIVYEFCCRCRSQFIVCCRCCCCCCCCSGVLWFLLLACFTSASRHVLLMFLLGLSLVQLLALCPLRLSWPSWPQQPQAQPSTKSYFLIICRGRESEECGGWGSHRPRYFLLALFVVGHNTNKKKKESELLIAFSICC